MVGVEFWHFDQFSCPTDHRPLIDLPLSLGVVDGKSLLFLLIRNTSRLIRTLDPRKYMVTDQYRNKRPSSISKTLNSLVHLSHNEFSHVKTNFISISIKIDRFLITNPHPMEIQSEDEINTNQTDINTMLVVM